MVGQKVETWPTEQLVEFLKQNGLAAIVGTFEEHGVTGLDMMLLTEGELRSMLGISQLQAAKTKSLINAAAEPPPAPGTDAAAAAAAPSAHSASVAAAQAAAADTDFEVADIPRVSEDTAHYGDEAAQKEMVRATSVRVNAKASDPTLPTGTAFITLDATTVGHYQRAVATISQLELEGVAQALPAARSRLSSIQKRLKLQQDKFEELRGEEAKQAKKLDKLEEGKWYPGKYLLGSSRREAKLAENKEKLSEKSSKLRAVGSELEQLHLQQAEATKALGELTAKCAALEEARGYAGGLLQNAFQGGMVGDATENALETEVVSLGPKVQEVRRFKTVYAQSYELLHGAKKALEQAHQLLESAAALARADMVGNVFHPGMMNNNFGGVMIDVMKRRHMQQGIQLCHQAGELAIKGRMMVPDMPRVDVDKLKHLSMGFGMMDVVFDNIVSDMMVAKKIQGILQEVAQAMSDVSYGERWLEGWLKGRIDQDLRTLEATLAQRREQLHAHRSHLLAAWIEARSKGAVKEGPAPAAGVPVQAGPQAQHGGYAQGYVV